MRIKYYLLSSGKSPVEDFLKEQSDEVRASFVDAANLLISGQFLKMPLSRSLSGIYRGLHELRLKDRSGQVRIFYYIKKGEAIYMLHANRKKTREIPKKEMKIILKRLKEV